VDAALRPASKVRRTRHSHIIARPQRRIDRGFVGAQKNNSHSQLSLSPNLLWHSSQFGMIECKGPLSARCSRRRRRASSPRTTFTGWEKIGSGYYEPRFFFRGGRCGGAGRDRRGAAARSPVRRCQRPRSNPSPARRTLRTWEMLHDLRLRFPIDALQKISAPGNFVIVIEIVNIRFSVAKHRKPSLNMAVF